MKTEQEDTGPKGTWIVKLNDEETKSMVANAYEAHKTNFFPSIASRLKGMSEEDIATFLSQGTPEPSKHNWATEIFLEGLSARIAKK